MTKTAVQIDLIDLNDVRDKMRIHAILSDGKLASDEMYFHVYESREDGTREYQFGRLTDEDGTGRTYSAEWGCGDESSATFDFLDRPLAVGQQVTRTDVRDGERIVFTCEIESIIDLLG